MLGNTCDPHASCRCEDFSYFHHKRGYNLSPNSQFFTGLSHKPQNSLDYQRGWNSLSHRAHPNRRDVWKCTISLPGIRLLCLPIRIWIFRLLLFRFLVSSVPLKTILGPVCGVPHRSPLDWIEEQHWLWVGLGRWLRSQWYEVSLILVINIGDGGGDFVV